jgi:hypothetical protein
MTRLDLQNLFLQWVNDPNGTFFSPVNFVQPALNRALKELQKQLVMSGDLYYVKSPPTQTTTVQNQADYVLPSDMLKINRFTVDLDTSSPIPNYQELQPMTLNQSSQYGNLTGTPESYYITKDKVSLFPCPDTSGKILRMWYSYQVADMTSDSSVPDCPEIYQEYIAIIAVLDAQIKDETIETNIKEKQMRYENLMKQMAMDRQYQRARMIRCYDDEGSWTAY